MSAVNEGIASAINPQPRPKTSPDMDPSEIRNDNPTPTVVSRIEARIICRVDGKATRLMKL